MNDRIKELYIQTANETADGKEWAIGGLLNAKRFAELIIRKCAARADVAAGNHCEWIGGNILVYFGVEE